VESFVLRRLPDQRKARARQDPPPPPHTHLRSRLAHLTEVSPPPPPHTHLQQHPRVAVPLLSILPHKPLPPPHFAVGCRLQYDPSFVTDTRSTTELPKPLHCPMGFHWGSERKLHIIEPDVCIKNAYPRACVLLWMESCTRCWASGGAPTPSWVWRTRASPLEPVGGQTAVTTACFKCFLSVRGTHRLFLSCMQSVICMDVIVAFFFFDWLSGLPLSEPKDTPPAAAGVRQGAPRCDSPHWQPTVHYNSPALAPSLLRSLFLTNIYIVSMSPIHLMLRPPQQISLFPMLSRPSATAAYSSW
jgi:hypothetical protein